MPIGPKEIIIDPDTMLLQEAYNCIDSFLGNKQWLFQNKSVSKSFDQRDTSMAFWELSDIPVFAKMNEVDKRELARQYRHAGWKQVSFVDNDEQPDTKSVLRLYSNDVDI